MDRRPAGSQQSGETVPCRRDQAPAGDEINDFAQAFVLIVVISRLITACPQLRHFGRSQAEEEEILRTDFLANLDIRPVERPDGERAIKRELHVAGAARFFSRGGNLL